MAQASGAQEHQLVDIVGKDLICTNFCSRLNPHGMQRVTTWSDMVLWTLFSRKSPSDE